MVVKACSGVSFVPAVLVVQLFLKVFQNVFLKVFPQVSMVVIVGRGVLFVPASADVIGIS